MAPKISVVMSVYQGERYLEEALDSVLDQTWRDYEYVIVDDGSTDATGMILTRHAARDRRIVLLKNERNLGLTKSLNRALSVACGEYVARQDADDVSMPRRLESQIRFMESRPDVGLLGTACRVIDAEGRAVGECVWPANDTAIRWQMLFHNAFCHSSVMWRRAAFAECEPRYDERYHYSQDYALWSQLLTRVSGANLDEPLVSYRAHDRSIESTSREAQQDMADQIALQTIGQLLNEKGVGREDVRTLRQWYNRWPDRLGGAGPSLCVLYLRILAAFIRTNASRFDDVAGIRHSVLERVLPSLARSSTRELWRVGLAGALLRLDAPFVVKFMGGEYGARMKRGLRSLVGDSMGEQDGRRRT